jgi:hypothetical protein
MPKVFDYKPKSLTYSSFFSPSQLYMFHLATTTALSFCGKWDIASANVWWISYCKYQNLTQDYIQKMFLSKITT